MFINIPDIQGSEWDENITKIWDRDWASEHGYYRDGQINRNWLFYVLDGTTFSGDPIHTTMCNSIRRLSYSFLDLELGGILEPWRKRARKECFTCVAGDDNVM